jgi:hypothetical protein
MECSLMVNEGFREKVRLVLRGYSVPAKGEDAA